MSFTLSRVEVSDAGDIARYVEVPAMQTGPLYRTMFPKFNVMTAEETNEIIQWYREMLEEALQDGKGSFLKASCSDGTPVGLCGWTVVDRGLKGSSNQAEQSVKKGEKEREDWLPKTLDVDAWVALSQALRTERGRVLDDLDDVCRLTFMAVDPRYQRQGIGSLLMQAICEETDRHRRCSYVLAAPEGVPLYTRFGFDVAGQVESSQGPITSMLLLARSS